MCGPSSTLTHHVFPQLLPRAQGGSKLASGSKDASIKIWDVAKGTCERSLKGHAASVSCLALSADGKRLMSGSGDHSIVVWDLATGNPERALKGHDNAIAAVLFLPDGRPVSAGNDLVIRVWGAAGDKCELQLQGHAEGVCALACVEKVPSGFATGEDDPAQRAKPQTMAKIAKVISAITAFRSKVKAAALTEAPQPSRSAPGRALASEWQPPPVSGAMIMSGCEDATVCAWRASDGSLLRELRGHEDFINSVLVLPDGRVATASDDQTLRVWDLASGKCLHVLSGHQDSVCAVVHVGGSTLVSGSGDATLRVWNADSGKCLKTLTGHADYVRTVAVASDGVVASGGDDSELRLWDVASGKCLKVLAGHTSWIWVVIKLTGGRLVSGASGCCFSCSEPTTKSGRVQVLTGGALALPPLSGSRDTTMRIWDVATGDCLHVLSGASGAASECALPNAKCPAAAGGGDDRCHCSLSSAGHTKSVSSITLLGDGRLVSGSGDHSLRVWRPEDWACEVRIGRCRASSPLMLASCRSCQTDSDKSSLPRAVLLAQAVLEGHARALVAVEALGDGRVVSASNDNTIRLW